MSDRLRSTGREESWLCIIFPQSARMQTAICVVHITDHEIQSRSATSVRIFHTVDELDSKSFHTWADKFFRSLVIGYVELPIRPFRCKICLYANCVMISIGELVRECTCLVVQDSKKTVAASTELGQVFHT